MQLTKDLESNITLLNKELKVKKNYDIIYRRVDIGGRKGCFYFIDGFTKDEMMQRLLQAFQEIKPEDMVSTAKEFSRKFLPYGEVDIAGDKDKVKKSLLSGVPCLLIEGYAETLMIDFRSYPARGVEQPEKEKALRGSKDGFVETIVFNTALIRRRIRSTELIMENYSIGKSSKTDVVLSYMEDRVDKKALEEVKNKLNKIKIDALTMNGESLAECLYQHKWYNPFPKFKYSERPDTTAASILEGSIILIVDNSPAALILPTSIFDIMEEADDYYFPPITGTYLRLSRFVINFFAVFLTPGFVLLFMNPDWIPKGLSFIRITDAIHIPIVVQFLILEFAIDGLRMASINTPSMLSTPLSVVAAIVLGDYTVSSGWFNSEIMLYMAFVVIANYSQVSFELGYALKFMRILLLILTGVFGIYGFIAGTGILIAAIVCNKSIAGRSYIYPLIPFDGRQLMRRFFRVSLPRSEKEKRV
ncbi:MAG: spore germination protein [Acetivibrio sp.]